MLRTVHVTQQSRPWHFLEFRRRVTRRIKLLAAYYVLVRLRPGTCSTMDVEQVNRVSHWALFSWPETEETMRVMGRGLPQPVQASTFIMTVSGYTYNTRIFHFARGHNTSTLTMTAEDESDYHH